MLDVAQRNAMAPLLEAVRAINADLRRSTLLREIVEAARRLARSATADLFLTEDGTTRCVAASNAEQQAFAGTLQPVPEQWPTLRELRTSQDPVFIQDTSANPSWSDVAQSFPYPDRVKTLVGLPLVLQNRFLGFLSIGYHTPTDVSSEERGSLQEFCKHASIALANAKLVSEEADRAMYALLRSTVSEALRDTRQVTSVARNAAGALGQAIDVSWCAVFLGSVRGTVTPTGMFGKPGVFIDRRIEVLLPLIAGSVANHHRLVAVTDMAADPAPEAAINANRELLLACGVTSLLAAPMTVDADAIGALVLIHLGSPRTWSGAEVVLVEQVAADLGMAIAQARTYEAMHHNVAALSDERTMLRAAAFQSSDGVLISDLPPHRMRFWNNAAVSLAASGAPMSSSGESEPPRLDPYHVDGRPYPLHEWPLTRAFTAGVTIVSEESLLRRRDGSFALVLVSASPTTDSGGRVTGAIAVIRDISAQRQAEACADQRERQLESSRRLMSVLALGVGPDDVLLQMLGSVRDLVPFDAFAARLDVPAVDFVSHVMEMVPGIDAHLASEAGSALQAVLSSLAGNSAATALDDLQRSLAPEAREPASRLGLRSAAIIPLVLGQQHAGVAAFFSKQAAAFTKADCDLLSQIILVLGLARLQQRQSEELQQAATAEERERLAREIHDVLAQMITSVVLQLENMVQGLSETAPEREPLEQIRAVARSAVAEMRRIVWNLKATSVDLGDPKAVVAEEAEKLQRRSGVKPEVVVTGEEQQVAPEVGAVLQRLVRVAFDNVWSHSEAQHVRVLLDYGLHAFTLLVEDDGIGFDPDVVDLRGAGRVGLAGVAERATAVGGSLRVESAANRGTRVSCTVPYTPATPAPRPKQEPAEPQRAVAHPAPDGPQIRVVLIDDHSMVRQGLEHMLSEQQDLQVVGAAGTGSEGLRIISELRPDVVLCDLQLPDISGVEVISRVRTLFPDVRCVIVTTYDNDDFIYEGIKSGAKGYVLKDVSAQELADAVRAAARNESLLQPVVAGKLLERFGEMARQGDMVEALTEREIGVLKALATGSRNKEIALQLNLSESTIKTHLASIFGKLGVTTRTEAVTRGRELGLIPL